jgi:hypothetical protein
MFESWLTYLRHVRNIGLYEFLFHDRFLFLCYIDTEHPTKMVEPCIFGRVESCDLVGIINLLSVITCKIRIILDKSYARSARSLGGSDRSRAATVWTSRYAVNGLRREEAVSDFNEISH